ncbi:organic cation transporter protein-like [Colias croceus]|uniref:organic cation transporter protein-like n=1 Tax=Colias crocea TaxID=72248 RepID=UPI001E27F956|nr:organic cation transporter protein-like [Colias croceus]
MQDTKEEGNGGNKKVHLDTILVEEIGQFGPYQLRTVALSALVVLFIGWSASEYIFTAARINTRCFIPECETREFQEFSPEWVLNAIPASGSSFDNCQRYPNVTIATGPNDTCPKDFFDRNNVVPCEEFVYENTHSVVYDYDLACDEWRRTFIGSIRNLGNFIALPITGYVSDRWGRRLLLTVSAVNAAVLGVLRYFANTYIGFFISQVAESTFGSGGFSCAYILMMEIVGPKYRVAAGATMNTFYAVGQVTLGFIVWALPNWRKLTLAIYIPQFVTISYFWILSESIRWYLSKGRYADAEEILKKAAKVNGRELSEKSLEALRLTVEEEKVKAAAKTNEPWLVLQVIRNRQILIRTVVSPIWWVTMTLVYYGLSVNAVNISGNMYLNYVAVSAVEIPGYWMAVFLMERVGRKPVLMGAYWVCAACQIAYIFMPDELFGVSLTVYLIGKCCISMVITSLYVYTAELYPTKYRHSLFAFSSMIGRLGSITAPLTPAMGAAIWDDFPYALFAGFALVSGFLVLITPETLGTKLPDTMQEASDIGNTSTS